MKKVLFSIVWLIYKMISVLLVAAVLCSFFFVINYSNKPHEQELRESLDRKIEEEYSDGLETLEVWHDMDYIDAAKFDEKHGVEGRELIFEDNTFIYVIHLPDVGYDEKELREHFDQYNKRKADELNYMSGIKDITVRYIYKDSTGKEVGLFEETYHYEDE